MKDVATRVSRKAVEGTTYLLENGESLISVSEGSVVNGFSGFVGTCSVCSEDTELWPYGSIRLNIRHVRKKRCPCGCSKATPWTDCQLEILIGRLLANRPLKLLSLSEGRGDRYATLENTVNGETRRVRVSNLQAGHLGNGKIYTFDEVSDLQKEVMTKGDYEVGSRITPNYNGSRTCWDFHCPLCENDELANTGLCKGVFPCRLEHLIQGRKPCRCSGKYLFTEDQRVFQLTELCKSLGYTFHRITNFNGRGKKFEYTCDYGHKRDVFMLPFLHQGRRCKLCSKDAYNSSGYYPLRSGELDNLYLGEFTKDSETFVKIGRTFNPSARQCSFTKDYNFTYLSKVTGLHGDIYAEEQRLQGLCNQWHYTPDTPFKGSVKECFTVDILSNPEIVTAFNL